MSRPRLLRLLPLRTGTARVAIGASLLLVAGPLALASHADAAAPPQARAAAFVDLGAAASYSVLGGAGVTSTGATELALSLGLSATGVITGFPPGIVHGETHDKDAAAAAAQTARNKAYGAAAGQDPTDEIAGDLAGTTFLPGVHHSAAAATNSGTITLDAQGNSSAVFVFQVDAALSAAASAEVVLANGALANNVFWQVVGAVSLGAGAHYVGTFLGAGAIGFGAGASLKGRALTPSTVTLASSPVTQPIDDLTAPVVTITGGPTAATNDTTPTISGTTDEPAGQSVTVTVAGQTLSTTVLAGGAWAVSATVLTEGPHTVVATSTDASQNTGTASQVLTVDTDAPTVTVDGGATRATNDTTPTISGTTDAPAATAVSVAVGGQTLPTTVGAGGTWTVTAAALTEAAHGVVASVSDAAGNTGTAGQILTVDVTVPVLAIDGGPSRFTTDTSPWTYGTTAEQAGTIVHVTIDAQSLTATVQPGGTWGVSAQDLPSATYPVLATITDAAGNTGSATQSLQIGDVVTTPTVTVDGGGTRSTNDATPTIAGTSNAPGATPVSVTVSGQSLATTVGAGGVWTVDATTLVEGSHTVVASVTVGGNTGTATQVLTVDLSSPVLTIEGGAARSTTDSTPRVKGTTTEPAGTAVQVTVGGQALTATALSGGAWGIGADTLAEGTYIVAASITDAAGNTGTATQTLTIASATPPVTPPTTPPVVAPPAAPVFPPSRYKPDAEIRTVGGTFIGGGEYGASKQTAKKQLGRKAKSVMFEIRVTNRGDVADRMDLLGSPKSKAFKVAYLAGGKDVTKAVLAGTYRTDSLKPGESVLLTVRITKVKGAKKGSKGAFAILATSSHEAISQDTVTAAVTAS